MNRGNSTIPVDEDWETGEEIDWRYYWRIINRRKWSIIGLALAVGLLTTLVVFAMTPIYRASTTLLIESQAPNVVSIQEVYGLDASGWAPKALTPEFLITRNIGHMPYSGGAFMNWTICGMTWSRASSIS